MVISNPLSALRKVDICKPLCLDGAKVVRAIIVVAGRLSYTLPCLALQSLSLVASGDFFDGYKIGRCAQVSDSLSFVPKGTHGLQG